MEIKEREKVEEDKQSEEIIANELELRHEIIQPQARIKEDLTSDYILAKLTEEEKEVIIEISNTAYFIKRTMDRVRTDERRYEWDETKEIWYETELKKEDKRRIKEIGAEMFDTYMVRTQVSAILNRNKKDNHLIRLILGQTQDQEETETQGKDKKLDEIKERIKELSKGN